MLRAAARRPFFLLNDFLLWPFSSIAGSLARTRMRYWQLPMQGVGHKMNSVASWGLIVMLTAEDCRRKAQEWKNAAPEVSNSDTNARMHHVAELWTRLAEQIERTDSLKRPDSEIKRPIDAVTDQRATSIQIGDVLRGRLRIGSVY
jgi:hypothetical protein